METIGIERVVAILLTEYTGETPTTEQLPLLEPWLKETFGCDFKQFQELLYALAPLITNDQVVVPQDFQDEDGQAIASILNWSIVTDPQTGEEILLG